VAVARARSDRVAACRFPAADPARNFVKLADLRYGENPHQRGALYATCAPPGTLATARFSCRARSCRTTTSPTPTPRSECVRQFDAPACVIVKHANPLRRGRRRDGCCEAYDRAYATDPTSAFGGIIAFNRRWTRPPRRDPQRQFVEVVIAPDRRRRARRVREEGQRARAAPAAMRAGGAGLDYKRIGGGLLVQDRRHRRARPSTTCGGDEARRPRPSSPTCCSPGRWRCTSSPTPSSTRSDLRTVGIGAGQMSRVVSAKIAGSRPKRPDWWCRAR
jgi:phosphoribosylaminoimidazolecarboxamide formyltransferase / IMP cyclohydrolase